MVQFREGSDLSRKSLRAMFLDIGMIDMVWPFYHKIDFTMAKSAIE